ncbi:MAG: hypothetical protein M3O15_08000, partial [Acidobacteriota bacterium]|nr:hypothetical protein [Acidobacteriota bacterium]
FYTVPPCRILDTRNPAGPLGGPALAANALRSIDLAGQCGIPAAAQAVSLNLTVTGATGTGDLRAFAGGTTPPLATALSFRAGRTQANNAVLPVAQDGHATLTVQPEIPASGTVHLIVDVNGYFQ